ncbi:hypothetical protein [uncultured Alsobacter sp.]|uniref:hypothetical protein n=1 Tax=uncultured Alsobacter sp. TaxID=1748258 RepID=UPI0025D51523|nr:hypothetical protein [uncultured Alsobacter sp.]
MAHVVDELREEAEAAIAAMREAALRARTLHARAELMRHMLTTARKVMDKPRGEAVESVVREWMAAWHLDRAAWPHVARDMERLTQAFLDYAATPAQSADAALRSAIAGLDEALGREGTSIADQMAYRSQCAHGWWELVAPTPADLPGRKDRPMMPAPEPGRPFWDAGCADFCR